MSRVVRAKERSQQSKATTEATHSAQSRFEAHAVPILTVTMTSIPPEIINVGDISFT